MIKRTHTQVLTCSYIVSWDMLARMLHPPVTSANQRPVPQLQWEKQRLNDDGSKKHSAALRSAVGKKGPCANLFSWFTNLPQARLEHHSVGVEFEKETEVTTKTLSLASNLFTVPCFPMYLWHQTRDMRRKKKNKAKNPQRPTSLMAMGKELYIFLVGLHPFSYYPTFIIIINLLSYISVEV